MLVTAAGAMLLRRRRASVHTAIAPTEATTASPAAIQVVVEGDDEPDGVDITNVGPGRGVGTGAGPVAVVPLSVAVRCDGGAVRATVARRTAARRSRPARLA